MSNPKKQKPAAAVWRGNPIAAPTAHSNQPATNTNAHADASAPHRILWRGVETTTEATDANRHQGETAHAHAPSMWRGHQVAAPQQSPASTSAPTGAPEPVHAVVQEVTPTAGLELSTTTSLDDLFKAILGDQAGDADDRALLLETVEAQVRGLRDELGLPEPVVEAPAPAPVTQIAAAEPDAHDPTLSSFEGDRGASKRVPGLFKMVAGLALGRFSHS